MIEKKIVRKANNLLNLIKFNSCSTFNIEIQIFKILKSHILQDFKVIEEKKTLNRKLLLIATF